MREGDSWQGVRARGSRKAGMEVLTKAQRVRARAAQTRARNALKRKDQAEIAKWTPDAIEKVHTDQLTKEEMVQAIAGTLRECSGYTPQELCEKVFPVIGEVKAMVLSSEEKDPYAALVRAMLDNQVALLHSEKMFTLTEQRGRYKVDHCAMYLCLLQIQYYPENMQGLNRYYGGSPLLSSARLDALAKRGLREAGFFFASSTQWYLLAMEALQRRFQGESERALGSLARGLHDDMRLTPNEERDIVRALFPGDLMMRFWLYEQAEERGVPATLSGAIMRTQFVAVVGWPVKGVPEDQLDAFIAQTI